MNTVLEGIKKAFMEDNTKALIEFWNDVTTVERVALSEFFKNMPKDVLSNMIDKIRLLNEYIAGDICDMIELQKEIEEISNTPECPEITIMVCDKEYNAKQSADACKSDPSFVKDFLTALLSNYDRNFIDGFVSQMILADPEIGLGVRSAVSQTMKIANEVENEGNKPAENNNEKTETMEKKFEKLYQEFIENLMKNPEEFIAKFSDFKNQFENITKFLFEEYAEVYEKASDARNKILKSKAKSLGAFKTELKESGITEEPIIKHFIIEENRRLNQRLQII